MSTLSTNTLIIISSFYSACAIISFCSHTQIHTQRLSLKLRFNSHQSKTFKNTFPFFFCLFVWSMAKPNIFTKRVSLISFKTNKRPILSFIIHLKVIHQIRNNTFSCKNVILIEFPIININKTTNCDTSLCFLSKYKIKTIIKCYRSLKLSYLMCVKVVHDFFLFYIFFNFSFFMYH